MILRATLVLCLCAGAALAQNAGDTARRAAALLSQAAADLDSAQGARDRVRALTAVVSGYEEGLSALRDGLRQVTIRERALTADLATREEEIARLLGVLSNMERAPAPLLLLHPSGALGTARSSMMLGEIAPALQAEAASLRADLADLQELRLLEEAAAQSLEDGLAGVQAARLALSQAVASRTDLPPRLAEDAARIAEILGRVDTLQAFADELGSLPMSAGQTILDLPVPLPVAGAVIRRFNEPDAAGIQRPGWIVATSAGSLVTTPMAGTMRYAGPLLDYGNVIILEPRPGAMVVFAGLAELYVSSGQVVVAGEPLGLMGGPAPKAADFLREAASGGGASRSETLYVEVREAGRPIDPGPWFADE